MIKVNPMGNQIIKDVLAQCSFFWNNKIFLFWHIFFVSKYFVSIHVCKTNGILNIHVFVQFNLIKSHWCILIRMNHIEYWIIMVSRSYFFKSIFLSELLFLSPYRTNIFQNTDKKQKTLRGSNVGNLTYLVKKLIMSSYFSSSVPWMWQLVRIMNNMSFEKLLALNQLKV